MKAECPHCHEIVQCPDPKEIIRREPCVCGLTEPARMVRSAALVAVALFVAVLGGCWMSNYYTTEMVRAMPDKFKLAPNYDAIPAGPVKVTLKDEEKK